MASKSVQWTIWAFLMVLFTTLTLTARWLDLAFALTVTAVVWYGIVPAPRSCSGSSWTHTGSMPVRSTGY